MAIANAVLDVVSSDVLLDDVRRKGERLRTQLDALASYYPDLVELVRGRG